jgi:hypothetical protein
VACVGLGWPGSLGLSRLVRVRFAQQAPPQMTVNPLPMLNTGAAHAGRCRGGASGPLAKKLSVGVGGRGVTSGLS